MRQENVRKEALMQVKQRMIADLPPPGSAMYRYFLDPKENPKPYSEQVKCESLTYEDICWDDWDDINSFYAAV